MELSSESNLFFHYTHNLDDVSFRALQEGQKLMVGRCTQQRPPGLESVLLEAPGFKILTLLKEKIACFLSTCFQLEPCWLFFESLHHPPYVVVDFVEYPSVIVRNLNHCIKEPHSHLAVLVMMRDGSVRRRWCRLTSA